MARLGTKPPTLHVVGPLVAASLDRLSKSALIDLYVQALALNLGAGDTPPTLAQVVRDAAPVLSLRGDRSIT